MKQEPDLILYGCGHRGHRSLQDIIDAAKAKFGEDCDLSQVEVETDERQIAGFGLFSTLAGENFPHGWVKAIEQGIWPEKGEYGNNFRKVFNLCKDS